MPARSDAPNLPVTRLDDLKARHAGEERWVEIPVYDGRNRAIVICAPPGTPGDSHLHPDYNEWWVILGGEISWQVGEYEPITAGDGDIVVAHCGARHDILPTGTAAQTIRLAVSALHSNHDIKGVPPSRQLPVHKDLDPPNLVHTPLKWMFERHGRDGAWAEEVVLDQRNRANMIYQLPGESNRPHWHPGFDEWWVVIRGQLEWTIGDREPVLAKKGDLVFVAEGYRHGITTVGDEPSVRLAVTTPDRKHIYTDGEEGVPPPRS